MEIKDFKLSTESLVKAFAEIVKENEELKNKLKLYELGGDNFKENLYDEEIIFDGNEEIKEKVVERLLVNLGLNEDKLNKTAVLFFGIDVSGSMGIWEKYMGRCVYTWVNEILKKKYSNVTVRFFIHHTESNEVHTIEDVFDKGLSGGTIVSSLYRDINKAIEDHMYKPNNDSDIFFIHVSDGDNLTADNKRSILTLDRIKEKIKSFTYLEVNQYERHSTLLNMFKKEDKNGDAYVIKKKEDVYYALAFIISGMFDI